QTENRAGLRHRFDCEYTRHDGSIWKMPVEEWFINCDVLQRDDPFVPINLENAVDQEKRISMRKDPQDLGDSQLVHCFLAGSGAGGFGVVEGGAAGVLGAVVAPPAGVFARVASKRRMISVVISAMSSR